MRRELAEEVVKQEGLSIARACKIVCLCRSMWYYRSQRDDTELIDKLTELAEAKPNRGFDWLYNRIRKQGHNWNRKRVLRVYRLLKMQLRSKTKKRLPKRIKEPLQQPDAPRQVWSADLMSDSLVSGRRFRIFNLIDDFNRQALCMKGNFSMPGLRVVEYLGEAIEVYGKPLAIRVDNGPEFLSRVFVNYCEVEDIEIKYIEPGKPSQNGYIERFNRTYREDVLDAHLFRDLQEVNLETERFKEEYNKYHPHKSLDRCSPEEFLENFSKGHAPLKHHFM